MKSHDCFDKTEEYNDEIIDLVTKLRIACNRNKMPMFVSICTKNNEKETVYKNEMVSAASSGIRLKDDKLVEFVKILNGFSAVPREDELDIEFDD